MTDEQKNKILELRQEGLSTGDVSRTIGVSYDAVRSFCKRYNIVPGFKSCPQCGMPIPDGMRRFCSADCRNEFWRIHKNESYKGEFHFVCENCKKEFVRKRNYHPKYCSHRCYSINRFHKEEQNG